MLHRPLQEEEDAPRTILAGNLADDIREGARAGIKPAEVLQDLLPHVTQLLQVSGNAALLSLAVGRRAQHSPTAEGTHASLQLGAAQVLIILR